MFHVGSDYVDFSQKYHMVAFNLDLMDAIWTEDDGKTSMLAKWDNIFNYFADGFTVCKASSGIICCYLNCIIHEYYQSKLYTRDSF